MVWVKSIGLDFVLEVSVVNVIKIKLVVDLHFRDTNHFVILIIHNCEIWCCWVWRWVYFFKIDAQSRWWLFDKFTVLVITQRSDQCSWCWKSCTNLSNVTPDTTNSTSWVSTTTFIQLKLFTLQRSVLCINSWCSNDDDFSFRLLLFIIVLFFEENVCLWINFVLFFCLTRIYWCSTYFVRVSHQLLYGEGMIFSWLLFQFCQIDCYFWADFCVVKY